MANRSFNRLQALEKEVKHLHLKVVTDGSGDVVSFDGLGVASVSHAADVYTITLQDKYVSFKHVSCISGVAANFQLNSEDVNGDKTVVVEASVTQASTDLYVHLVLKNTTVK